MKRFVLLVAGGTGTRMKSKVPKQFLLLKGKPVLQRTLEAFYQFDKEAEFCIVLPESHIQDWQDLCKKHHCEISHHIAKGGNSRSASVMSGLQKFAGSGIVAVHDGVRPLVSKELIANCFDTAAKKGAAIPTVPLKDSVRRITPNGSHAISRDDLRLVQTPQCFSLEVLKEAFEKANGENFTDEASLFEWAGNSVALIPGDYGNIKITVREDMAIAEALYT